uniref:Uncharacterized protein n=1 Tax=Fundidesulfovibrio putealis TaxID=270496 RepID=A0A7C4EJX7_9BACT
MKRSTLAALALTAAIGLGCLATPARAADQEVVLRCVMQEVLAVLTCKSPSEFRFVGTRDDVLVFNTYYAAKFTEFYCQVFDRDVVVTSRAWQGNMASARLNYEVQPGCIVATVNAPWAECRKSASVQCCGAD